MIETETVMSSIPPRVASRGEITGFSAKSRMRFLKLIHSLVFEKPLLITLTYGEYPKNGKQYHDDLRAFRSVFERLYGKNRVIWKLEFQKRKAPHFHLVCIDLAKVDIPECGKAWCRIAKIEDQEGKWQAFDVKSRDASGNDLRNAAAYAAKYVSKDVLPEDYEGVSNPGRFWGKWNIGKVERVSFNVPKEDIPQIAAELREALGYSDTPWNWYSEYNNSLFAGNAGSDIYQKELIALLEKHGYNRINS